MGDDLDRLLDEVWQIAYRVSYSILLSRDEAEDIAQECTFKFYERLEKIDLEGAWRGWVIRVSTNMAIDRWRKMKRVYPLNEAEQKGEEGHDLIRFLERCLAKLPLMQRAVISLFYLEERTVKEISELFNISEGTVKSHLFRGRKGLRNCLKEYL
jgi:RNA polymerase sigma-70 factor (ECF subfamily)